jgi:hypothetical protein
MFQLYQSVKTNSNMEFQAPKDKQHEQVIVIFILQTDNSNIHVLKLQQGLAWHQCVHPYPNKI